MKHADLQMYLFQYAIGVALVSRVSLRFPVFPPIFGVEAVQTYLPQTHITYLGSMDITLGKTA